MPAAPAPAFPTRSRVPSARAVRLVVLAGLLVAPALAMSALAQQEEACRPPRLLVSQGPAEWAPGGTFTYQLAVENDNVAPVESVTARLDATAPAGWSVSLSQTSVILRPEDAPVVAVTITAPQRGTGVATGEITISVQFTCHRSGAVDTRASAVTTIPVDLAEVRVPWLLLAGATGLIASVSLGVWAIRWRQGPVGLEATVDEKPVVPGKSVQFPLRVANRRRAPDTVRFTVENAPDGWTSHLAVPEIGLEGREERDVWVALRAPVEARYGDEVTVTVTAAAARSSRPPVNVRVTARVAREH